MRRMVTAGFVLLAAYAVIVVLAFAFQRNLLYFPPGPNPPPPPGLERVEIPTDDGLILTHWYRPPAPGAAVVVKFHGNASSIADSADLLLPLLEDGQGALLAEYRGYGGNPGRPTEAGLVADGRVLLKWLAEKGIGAERIVLYGRSLGSGVAVRLAAEAGAAGLVLESPFSSVVDVAGAHYPLLPVRWLVHDRWDSMAVIGRVRAPLLVVHGERDRVVPIRFGRKLFAAASEPKQFAAIPAAGHNDLLAHEKAVAGVRAFLARFGRPAPQMQAENP
ncbi:MAG: alpha/beta hydrolase [Alphaproteobacteria bacterium]